MPSPRIVEYFCEDILEYSSIGVDITFSQKKQSNVMNAAAKQTARKLVETALPANPPPLNSLRSFSLHGAHLGSSVETSSIPEDPGSLWCRGYCLNVTSSGNMAGWSRILFFALGLVVLMCSAIEARTASFGQVEASSSFGCDACLEFSAEAQIILADPDTRQQAVDMVTQMACQSLTPRLKGKCVELVNLYVLDALTVLQAYLGPEICTETGICVPESTRPFTKPEGKRMELAPLADAKTCILCQGFAKDALTYLGSNSTKSKIIESLHLACARLEDINKQCDLLVDVYAPDLMDHLDSIGPEEFCEMARICKPIRKPALVTAGLKRNDCAICKFVVLELKVKLNDPATQARLLEVLLNGCNRVQNHVDECKLIVGQYAPFVLANLDSMLDADSLCTKLRACAPHKVEDVEPFLALYSHYSEGHDHLRHRHRHQVHAL